MDTDAQGHQRIRPDVKFLHYYDCNMADAGDYMQ